MFLLGLLGSYLKRNTKILSLSHGIRITSRSYYRWRYAVSTITYLRHNKADIESPASGIGLAVVTRLLGLGWKVAILDCRPAPDQFAKHSLENSVLFVKTDVSVYKEQVEAFSQAHSKWGRLDFGA